MNDQRRPTTGDLPSSDARGPADDRVVELQSERAAYDVAVAAGDFDDAGAWIDAARASRGRPSGKRSSGL